MSDRKKLRYRWSSSSMVSGAILYPSARSPMEATKSEDDLGVEVVRDGVGYPPCVGGVAPDDAVSALR